MTEIEVTQTETTKTCIVVDLQSLTDEAIEQNIASLLTLHSNSAQLIKQLQNTAIDNAFIEVTQRLDDIETAHEVSMSNVTATLLKLDLKIKKLEDAQP
jgi:hypothetical protein